MSGIPSANVQFWWSTVPAQPATVALCSSAPQVDNTALSATVDSQVVHRQKAMTVPIQFSQSEENPTSGWRIRLLKMYPPPVFGMVVARKAQQNQVKAQRTPPARIAIGMLARGKTAYAQNSPVANGMTMFPQMLNTAMSRAFALRTRPVALRTNRRCPPTRPCTSGLTFDDMPSALIRPP